ncbi:probable serine hydrolase [Drosophila ficusphila]|uniref:probable serine hydrolase n=1 Tax=Drosophila ficusphila TaxID=30025 RepID=UPI0007E73EB5|nr:probable serine hydrolase [Drosophila ficusphila]
MGTLSLQQYEDVKIGVPWGHIAGRWYGNRAERPILAIHGWVDNLGTFDRLIPLLPDYLGVLCVDIPGHGRSSHHPVGIRYSSEKFVSIIPRIMREFGWKKVSLMGHSMGGFLSFVYSSLAPETVDMNISFDLIVPPFLKPDETIKWIRFSQEKHSCLDERMGRENAVLSREEFLKLIEKESFKSISPSVAHHLMHRVASESEAFPGKVFSTRDDRVKYFSKMYLLDHRLAEEMARRIKPMPYLIIKGSQSKFIGNHSSDVISLLSKNNPDFEFHEIEGSHHVHLNSAEECAKYVVPFIRRYHPPGKDLNHRSIQCSKL